MHTPDPDEVVKIALDRERGEEDDALAVLADEATATEPTPDTAEDFAIEDY